VAEDSSPVTDSSPAREVDTFLARLGNADPNEWERASSVVQSDQKAWKAAGGRVAQIVARMGLGEQKAQLCQRASAIFAGKAAQLQDKDRQYAIWAAHGVIVALLAGDSATSTDLRVLKMPFLHLLREEPIRTPGENAYCEIHPTVPLRFGHCQACHDEERYRRRW
jgi:hypothetical protein